MMEDIFVALIVLPIIILAWVAAAAGAAFVYELITGRI